MRAALLLVSGLLAGCLAPGAPVDPSSAVDDLLALVGDPVQVDPARWSGEPSILALADGTLLITGAGGLTRYVENPADAPGNAGQSYLWRSIDGGATWEFVDFDLPEPVRSILPYRNAILGVEGDLAEDEAGRAYFVDLTMLALNGIASSTDSGATWTSNQNPIVGQPVTDRPWVAAIGDGEVFVKYLQLANGDRIARSTDGGQSFPEDISLSGCGVGAPFVDVGSKEVLVPCGTVDELSLLRAKTGEAMAFEEVPGPKADGPVGNVFAAAAVAGPGQYVFAWSETVDGGHRLRVSASADRGATWTPAVTVSTTERSAVFPWVDATPDGLIAVVWYEADQWGDSNTLDAAWHAMHARLTLTNGALSAPTVSTLSPDPVHQGSICNAGLACVTEGRAEDRRLLDFFEVDIDASGRSHVAWTSTQTPVPTVWYGSVAAP